MANPAFFIGSTYRGSVYLTSGGSFTLSLSGTNNPVGSIVLVWITTLNQSWSPNPAWGWTDTGVHAEFGTAGADGTSLGTRLFWFPGTGATYSNSLVCPTTTEALLANWMTITGADLTNPINAASASAVTSAGSAISFPDVTTTVPETLVINYAAANEYYSGNIFSGGATNAGLTSITARNTGTQDYSGSLGTTHQFTFGSFSGNKATAGATGSTTASWFSSAAAHVKYTVAIQPAQPPVPMGCYWTY